MNETIINILWRIGGYIVIMIIFLSIVKSLPISSIDTKSLISVVVLMTLIVFIITTSVSVVVDEFKNVKKDNQYLSNKFKEDMKPVMLRVNEKISDNVSQIPTTEYSNDIPSVTTQVIPSVTTQTIPLVTTQAIRQPIAYTTQPIHNPFNQIETFIPVEMSRTTQATNEPTLQITNPATNKEEYINNPTFFMNNPNMNYSTSDSSLNTQWVPYTTNPTTTIPMITTIPISYINPDSIVQTSYKQNNPQTVYTPDNIAQQNQSGLVSNSSNILLLQNYLNALLVELYNFNIIDRNDIDNIKIKLDKNLITLNDTIVKLETLKINGIKNSTMYNTLSAPTTPIMDSWQPNKTPYVLHSLQDISSINDNCNQVYVKDWDLHNTITT